LPARCREFATAPTIYASASIPASAYFMRSHDEEMPEPAVAKPAAPASTTPRKPVEAHAPRHPGPRRQYRPVVSGKAAAARPHFSRPAAHTRDRKPSQSSSSSRPARPTGSRTANSARPASAARWSAKPAAPSNGKRNGAHAGNGSNNGNGRPAARPAASSAHSAKSAAPAWNPRNGSQRKVYSNGAKTAASPAQLPAPAARRGRIPGPPLGQLRQAITGKPSIVASARAGSSKRFGFSARPKQGTKKRG